LLYYAWTLWLRVYPAQARTRRAKALSLAQRLAHPYTPARTLYYDALLGSCAGMRQWSAIVRALLDPVYGWFSEGFDTPTFRMPRHCSRRWPNTTSVDTSFLLYHVGWVCS